MFNRLFFGLILLCVAALPLQAAAGELPPPQFVQVDLAAEPSAVKAGDTFWIAIDQRIAPGWHTYWVNAGDSGTPINIAWDVPPGITMGDLHYPAPKRLPMPPLMNFGYEDRALYLLPVTIAPDAALGEQVILTARIDWLVCKDICIPEGADYTLALPVADSGTGITQDATGLFAEARATHPHPFPGTLAMEEQDGVLTITLSPTSEQLSLFSGATRAHFFPLNWGLIQNIADQFWEWEGKTGTLSIARDQRPLAEIPSLDGVLVLSDEEGRSKAFSLTLAAGLGTVQDADGTGSLTWGTALVFALLGGLILNLMPCVFPVLSLKALALAKLSNQERTHARAGGWAYTGGIIVCFLVLAGILLGLQSAGSQVGWGFQLQHPHVTFALALLMVVIGFALFDWIRIPGSLANLGGSLAARQGISGSFWTGVLAAIVAAPCTAPFMAGAIGFALVQPALVGLSVFIALGFGLALPYLLLTHVPGLAALLPRPGPWMDVFKQFLAFPMFATALWLFWVFGQQTAGMALPITLGGIVLIGFLVWLGRFSGNALPFIRMVKGAAILGTLAALIALFFMIKEPAVNGTEDAVPAPAFGIPFSAKALDEALASPDPVWVTMTAAWCITCKVNEQVAIETPATKQVFADYAVKYLVGDWTNQDRVITKYLQSYGRSGVPIYVLYGPPDEQGRRPAPHILPQLLTESIVHDAVLAAVGEE